MSEESPEMKKTDRGTLLAEDRTEFAAERTLMAWIRTALSMISFGFTIYKFFQYLHDSKALNLAMPSDQPRNLGLLMVLLGTVMLALATLQHWRFVRQLKKETSQGFPVSLALVTACLISILGVLALLNLIFKIGPF